MIQRSLADGTYASYDEPVPPPVPLDRHRYPPISFRPPEKDRVWLLAYAEKHDLAVGAVLSIALAEFRSNRDPG